MTVLFVAIGGALGAILRFAVVQAAPFPFGTAVVNVLGSLIMGAAFVLLASKGAWQPFVMTGILGGFTTYSAFSLDALKLYEAGQPVAALGYAGGTMVLCLAAVTLGAALTRGLT